MASESNSKAELNSIPSNVSGDGKTFVNALKNFLKKYTGATDAVVDNVGEGTVEQVKNLVLTEEDNNIRIRYETSHIGDYSHAQIWIKVGSSGAFSQVGTSSGNTYLYRNTTIGETYTVKVVACNSGSGYADMGLAPTASITIEGSSIICNVPGQFYWSDDDQKWHWGNYVDNGYTDFFEIRLDKNPGIWSEYKLDSVPAGTYYSNVVPNAREGKAYLYVRNVFGEYNSPYEYGFTISAPSKPTEAPGLEATTNGVKVTLKALPSGCTHYIVDVDGVEYEVYSSVWTSYSFFGTIKVRYCFADSIGRGAWSEQATIATGRKITTTEITDNAITSPKIYAGDVDANKIQTANLAANCITADKIQVGAIDATKIKACALTVVDWPKKAITNDDGSTSYVDIPEAELTEAQKAAMGKVTIKDGSVSGNAIKAASIIGDRIAGNTITASHLKSQNIDLTGALAIVGGAVTLNGDGLTVRESNSSGYTGKYTLFNNNGISFFDRYGNTYAALHRICVGKAYDGEYVRFGYYSGSTFVPSPWDETPQVICVPINIQCNEDQYAQSNVFIVCEALNTTTEGFTVNCYTKLGAGSYVPQNFNTTYNGTASASPGYYTSTFTYNIDINLSPPTDATKGEVMVTTTDTSYRNANTSGSDHFVSHYTYTVYKLQILNNGSVITETGYSSAPSYVSGSTQEKTSILKLQFSATSFVNLKLRVVTLQYVDSNQNNSSWGYKFVFNSASFNSKETKITSMEKAEVMFIAIENNSAIEYRRE